MKIVITISIIGFTVQKIFKKTICPILCPKHNLLQRGNLHLRSKNYEIKPMVWNFCIMNHISIIFIFIYLCFWFFSTIRAIAHHFLSLVSLGRFAELYFSIYSERDRKEARRSKAKQSQVSRATAARRRDATRRRRCPPAPSENCVWLN